MGSGGLEAGCSDAARSEEVPRIQVLPVASPSTATSPSSASSDTEEENNASCATPKAIAIKTKKTAKRATSQRLRERLAASERMNGGLMEALKQANANIARLQKAVEAMTA